MVTDVVGTEIKQGDVITWCCRQSSAMYLSMGVVRTVEERLNRWGAKKTEYVITVDRVGAEQQIKHTNEARYLSRTRYFRKVPLTIPSYITVTGLTEEELKIRFPFEEQLEVMVKR